MAKAAKKRGIKGKAASTKKKSSPADSPVIEVISKKIKGKENRKWNNEATGVEAAALDRSKNSEINGRKEENLSLQEKLKAEDLEGLNRLKGKLEGQLADIDVGSSGESSDEEDEEEEDVRDTRQTSQVGI